MRSDESETDGALANILRVLQRVHSIFFDSVGLDICCFWVPIDFVTQSCDQGLSVQEHEESLVSWDVR